MNVVSVILYDTLDVSASSVKVLGVSRPMNDRPGRQKKEMQKIKVATRAESTTFPNLSQLREQAISVLAVESGFHKAEARPVEKADLAGFAGGSSTGVFRFQRKDASVVRLDSPAEEAGDDDKQGYSKY